LARIVPDLSCSESKAYEFLHAIRARVRETTKIPGVRTLMGELCQTYARGSPYTAPQSAALFAINGSTTTLVNDESAPSGTIIGVNAIPSLSNQENTGCAFQS